MSRQLLTASQLKQVGGISDADKASIENCAREYGGGYDEDQDILMRRAIRGYLARQFCDFEADDSLRDELETSAAAFADGWAWHEENGESKKNES